MFNFPLKQDRIRHGSYYWRRCRRLRQAAAGTDGRALPRRRSVHERLFPARRVRGILSSRFPRAGRLPEEGRRAALSARVFPTCRFRHGVGRRSRIVRAFGNAILFSGRPERAGPLPRGRSAYGTGERGRGADAQARSFLARGRGFGFGAASGTRGLGRLRDLRPFAQRVVGGSR